MGEGTLGNARQGEDEILDLDFINKLVADLKEDLAESNKRLSAYGLGNEGGDSLSVTMPIGEEPSGSEELPTDGEETSVEEVPKEGTALKPVESMPEEEKVSPLAIGKGGSQDSVLDKNIEIVENLFLEDSPVESATLPVRDTDSHFLDRGVEAGLGKRVEEDYKVGPQTHVNEPVDISREEKRETSASALPEQPAEETLPEKNELTNNAPPAEAKYSSSLTTEKDVKTQHEDEPAIIEKEEREVKEAYVPTDGRSFHDFVGIPEVR